MISKRATKDDINGCGHFHPVIQQHGIQFYPVSITAMGKGPLLIFAKPALSTSLQANTASTLLYKVDSVSRIDSKISFRINPF